jgi:predicted nucleotidyltransferase
MKKNKKYYTRSTIYPDYEQCVTKFNQSFHEGVNDTLNVKLFNDDNELKQEVKEKLLKIKDKFLETLSEEDIDLDVKDVVLVGSNVNYNYGPDSDIDLHIIADTSDYSNDMANLLDKTYNAYKTLFNQKYDLTIYEIPVEIYVESWNENA